MKNYLKHEAVLCAGCFLCAVTCTAGSATLLADGSVAGPLAVNGAADLSKGGVVSLAGDVAKLAPGDWPLLTASPLAADAAAWTCEPPSRMLSCRVVVSGNSLVLRVLPRGTIIMFR